MAKTYLVTGAAGFIGSRFSCSCTERGISVIGVDRLTHFTSRPERQIPDFKAQFEALIDRDEALGWLAQTKPKLDAIVHIGACSDTTQLSVEYLTKVNLQYSQKMWEYATAYKIPFIYASSAATYGDGSLGYADVESEIPKLKPLNPYGQSKQQFDLWVLEKERLGQTPASWAGFKFFNVYGFGERHKGKMASVILHAFDQIHNKGRDGGRVTLFKSHREGIADGEQKRDFIAVEDLIQVLHFALEKPLKRGILNLGTGQARSYLDLVRAVFTALEREPAIDFVDTPLEIRERYQYFTQAHMERLRSEGFTLPFTHLEDGVKNYLKTLCFFAI
ncbi:ADP-glyceromanno-heptose 6-epimerase [Bdellovibrionota bacterium FG-2]